MCTCLNVVYVIIDDLYDDERSTRWCTHDDSTDEHGINDAGMMNYNQWWMMMSMMYNV